MDNDNKPTPVAKMLEEIVDSVNNMSAEDGRRAAWNAGYGRPGDYRSFWD